MVTKSQVGRAWIFYNNLSAIIASDVDKAIMFFVASFEIPYNCHRYFDDPSEERQDNQITTAFPVLSTIQWFRNTFVVLDNYYQR